MNNLVQLSSFRSEGSNNVYGNILTYFNRIEQESGNTLQTYKRAVEDFFMTTRNKKLEQLTEEDLNFTMREVEAYQTELRKVYKGSTVNTKMSAIKKLMDKLEGYGLNVNSKVFDVDRYSQHDSESYDPMTKEEVIRAMEIVSKTRKGEEKALFLHVAFVTSFRKESIMNLKWSDIQKFEGEWTIKTLGKGNVWDRKKIPESLFLSLSEYRQKIEPRERIFTLAKNTVDGMMKLIKEKIDFGDRKIVFHSLKKAGIEEMALETNYDLKAMQAQGNHRNIATTLNSYMAHKKLSDMIALDLEKELDLTPLEELTKDELLSIIQRADRITKTKIMNLAKGR